MPKSKQIPLMEEGQTICKSKMNKYLFTGSLKKIDQLIFRNAKEINFNEKFSIL
jgi:hypothetical protein